MSENPHSLEKDIHAESNSSIIATGFDERITGLANDYPTGTARFLGFYENIIQEHERKLRQSNLEHLIKGTSEAGFKTYSVSDFFSKATSPLTVFYPGAVAAYSLRDLKANDGSTTVVRVRRDSDNDEKDFTARQIESGEMLNWVNEDVVTYESDFSAGTDGWAGINGTATGNIDGIGGLDDNLRLTATSLGSRIQDLDLVSSGNSYTLTADLYIPSTNSHLDGVGIWDIGGGALDDKKTALATDQWVSVTASWTAVNTWLAFRGLDGTAEVNDPAGDDVFYIRNIRITQLTSNAYATIWYDQSGVQVTETLAKGDIGNGNLDTAGSPTFDGWGNYKAGTTTIERDTVNQRSGLSCCKITLDGSSSNGFIYKAGLISGEVYRVSCWAKSDDGGKLLMDINNPSDPDAVFVLTSDWVKYERYAVSDGTNLTLGRQFTSSAGSTILIDDVEIEQLNKLPNDAIQSTAARQPKVVDAGVLVTDANGNVALDFDGVDDYMGNVDLDVFSTAPGTNNTFIFVSSQGGGASANETFIGPNAGTGGIAASSVWFIWLNTGASDITYGTADTNPNLHFVYLPVSGTSAFGAVNGVVDATIDTTLSSVAEGFNIGKNPSGGGQDYLGGAMSEVIIYNSDQSANRTAIETNIANHYGITLS